MIYWFRPVNKVKSNGSRVNRHQRLHLQSWCENYDLELVIDHFSFVEYLAKFASNVEKIVVKNGFVSFA